MGVSTTLGSTAALGRLSNMMGGLSTANTAANTAEMTAFENQIGNEAVKNSMDTMAKNEQQTELANSMQVTEKWITDEKVNG